MALTRLEIDGFRQLTARIITYTEVARSGCRDIDFGFRGNCRHTTAEGIGEEIAGLIVTVADCPTLLDESG